MTDESKPRVVESVPSEVGTVSAIASASAPYIYFDGVPNFGYNDGIARITLEALRFTSAGSDVLVDRVMVGHLRMSLTAFKSLKGAIDGIELMIQPAQGKTN